MSNTFKVERRGWHVDKTVNITNILGIIALIVSIYVGMQKTINYFSDQNYRVNVMWHKFAHDNPELINQLDSVR